MAIARLPADAAGLLADMHALDRLIAETRREFEQELAGVAKGLNEARGEFASIEVEQLSVIAAADAHVLEAEQLVVEAQARRQQVDESISTLIRDKVAGFEFIAMAWADYELARAAREAQILEDKSPSAPQAASVVRRKGAELAEARRRAKLNEWITKLYEFHYPWLEELRSFDEEESFVADAQETQGDFGDPARKWLRADELSGLTDAERNQRALERYLTSRKSPWQLGRDYERYVGYLREQDGWLVTYHGIIHGFEDLGRDVIAEKNGSIEVIQCKRWAQHKEIHEKHVFQLFGTMTAARIENPGKSVSGTFTTTTRLSARARTFAEALGIRVEESFPLTDYPRIKCNIARRDGERIYHLPFDQQYDATVIEPERGERYAMSCAEAELEGFRRAWRWKGEERD